MKIYQRIFEYTPDALLVVDQTGHITMVNAQAETLFDYDRSELVGQPIEMLIPPRFTAHHAKHRTQFMSESHNRPMGAASSLYAQRKNGGEFLVDIMLSPMIIDGHHFVLCVARHHRAQSGRRRAQAKNRGIAEAAYPAGNARQPGQPDRPVQPARVLRARRANAPLSASPTRNHGLDDARSRPLQAGE